MSKDYSQLLDHLLDGESLAESQAYDLMNKLAEGELPAALAAKDSLANRLGSLLIMFEKPFRVGRGPDQSIAFHNLDDTSYHGYALNRRAGEVLDFY